MGDEIYGTLNDAEIIRMVKEGKLIIEEFDEKNVKQACYELRAGNTYFDLTADGTKYTINDGEPILFRPHQTIVIITKEKLQLPNDILARFLTKGAFFSIGFTPINTYADPGFYGRMGIVMNNASNNYLKITCGDAIAKAEFTRLQTPVIEQYHGQHGFETQIWPIRKDYIISRNNLNQYFPEMDEIQEIESIYGESVANIMQRVLITEHRFVFATAILIIFNLIVIGLSMGTEWMSPIVSIICGIVSNIGYDVALCLIKKSKGRKRNKQ